MPSRCMFARHAWLVGLVLLAGCQPKEEIKTYPVRGVVKALQPTDQIVVLKHETIPGWMESMTMEFPVKQSTDFAQLAVGQTIRATVCQKQKSLEFWLEAILVEK